MRGRSKKQTHLDPASLPSEDGSLTFVAKEIVSTISKLCTKHFGMSFQNLGILFLAQNYLSTIDSEGTLMAREFPGSSSNLYSVSGSRTHSLVFELLVSLADIAVKITQKQGKKNHSAMNFCMPWEIRWVNANGQAKTYIVMGRDMTRVT